MQTQISPKGKQKNGRRKSQQPKLFRKSSSPLHFLENYRAKSRRKEKAHPFIKFISKKQIPKASTKKNDVNFITSSELKKEGKSDEKERKRHKRKQKDEFSPLKQKIDTTIEISKTKDSEQQAFQLFQEQKTKIERQDQTLRSVWGELNSMKKHFERISICLGMEMRKNEKDKQQLKKVKAKYKILKNKELYILSSDSQPDQ